MFEKMHLDPTIFFKAIADETRLRCLLLIAHYEELCVCELMAALGETQPKVSRHLAQLRKAGLLTDRKQSQWVFYSLNSLPQWAHDVIIVTLEHQQHWLKGNFLQLEQMGSRPERLVTCC
ncbi:ArsR/SmtB family transcription factor [Marinomonas spartinae]|uniref:ArsR/SmtB family transcription factor n=1 Tax=Marinomonas spartinae TaxID=1792290 RepID=UPI001F2F4FCC|nr:metalloregulator ArsR/SmtB family transcription factor [Marinomonas spartinae]